jgi:protein-S-isoprenylcysteine O-methyltransferase Ste14
MILRHALSILLLPCLVVIVIPAWLLTADSHWRDGALLEWLPRSMGIALFVTGFLLFSWCVSLFVRVGQGTLAPWDPTRNLVAVGPYRHVRNPMISGVAMMLLGEALVWGSWPLSLWAGLVILINHLYFVVSEEPGLEERFGESYRVYKTHVPRWLPRLRPWSGQR